jgi:hypothetical protein
MGKRFYLGMCLPMLRETELLSKRNLFNYDYIEALCWCMRAASQVHTKLKLWPSKSRGRGIEWPDFVESKEMA